MLPPNIISFLELVELFEVKFLQLFTKKLLFFAKHQLAFILNTLVNLTLQD